MFAPITSNIINNHPIYGEFRKPELFPVIYNDWDKKGVIVSVLREDLVHPFISGNKWRKLKYNFIDFASSGKKQILTYGGAFSNHIIATAAAAESNGYKAIGIIRGENKENDYLKFAQSHGMKLHFISRSDYRNKSDEGYSEKLLDELISINIIHNKEDVFSIPEGGSNPAAVRGTAEIMDEIPDSTDYVVCACGTGGTIAGISTRLREHQKAIGISVLKADGYFEKQIAGYGAQPDKIELFYDYHFGGYAKRNEELLLFCKDFSSKTGIPVEPVYTGKLFYAINDLINKNYFKPGSNITIIHTGGIFEFKS